LPRPCFLYANALHELHTGKTGLWPVRQTGFQPVEISVAAVYLSRRSGPKGGWPPDRPEACLPCGYKARRLFGAPEIRVRAN